MEPDGPFPRYFYCRSIEIRSQFKSLINEIFDGGGHGRRKYIILIDCVVGEWRWETLKDTVTI